MGDVPWPLIRSEALTNRVITGYALRRFTALYPGIYVPTDAQITPRKRAEAAWLWSRRKGTIAGVSAAALHGTKWLPQQGPAVLIHTNRRAPRDITLWSDSLPDGERMFVEGLPVTTPARTAFDIGRRTPVDLAVQHLDALMNATGFPASISRPWRPIIGALAGYTIWPRSWIWSTAAQNHHGKHVLGSSLCARDFPPHRRNSSSGIVSATLSLASTWDGQIAR
ncbi:cullin, a subunit of E3 ubiquitin ligase [Mycobacteroides abscessus]|nr:cullin, a subunit of E3 ubiquitin ligase [Mycobacteroides abscessus]